MRNIDYVNILTKVLMLIEVSGNDALIRLVSDETKPLFEYFGKKMAEENEGVEDGE